MNGYRITITEPSDPFIDLGRDIEVKGSLSGPIEDDMTVEVCLYDEEGNRLRYARQTEKNDRNIFIGYPGLLGYEEELDPGKEKLKDYGFPELQVKDLQDPYASLYDASIKCFYDDRSFKAILVSASDVKHGKILDAGITYLDENGRPFDLLKEGKYLLRAFLYHKDGTIAAEAEKTIVIALRKEAAIVRFNPVRHRERMTKWCRENGFNIVNDTLPGYLEPYLGTWYYHMGLLKYYRSNDIAVYQDAAVHMFVYLCDPTSTSYETELAYLQTRDRVGKEEYFKAFHYDIGEAELGKGKSYARKGEILPFEEDLYLYRVDLVNDLAKENVFDLNEEAIEDVFYDVSKIEVTAPCTIAVSGVAKPWQAKKGDVILKDDNTCDIAHEISIVHYEIDDGKKRRSEERKLLMERIDEKPIGKSVYEFCNLFSFDEKDKGKEYVFHIDVRNDMGRKNRDIRSIKISVR